MDIYNIRLFIVWLGGWLVGRQVPVHDVYKHLWEACMRGHLWEACMRGFLWMHGYLWMHGCMHVCWCLGYAWMHGCMHVCWCLDAWMHASLCLHGYAQTMCCSRTIMLHLVCGFRSILFSLFSNSSFPKISFSWITFKTYHWIVI